MRDITEKEKSLMTNNTQATEVFTYLISIIIGATPKQVSNTIASKTDDLMAERGDATASTAAYSQMLIDELAAGILCKVETMQVNRVTDIASNEIKVDQDYSVNLIGGDILDSRAFIEAEQALNNLDALTDMLYEIFIDMHNAPEAIFKLPLIMAERSAQGENTVVQLPGDTFLRYKSGINSKNIAPEMIIYALIGYMLMIELFSKNKNILGIVRINNSHIDLLIDLYNSDEVVLTNKKEDEASYYHVYYQGFHPSNGTGVGYGSAAVRCDEIFDLDLLQGVIEQKVGIQKALVVNWTKIDSKKLYNKLNNL